MVWQDIVFTVGSFVFAVALIPSIISKGKPALLTSLTTAMVLLAFVICYLSLGFIVSAISGSLVYSGWIILFIQKLVEKK